MAGFISSADETDFRNTMALVHETWAKPVIIYQTSQKTVISTNPNHNFLYNSGPNQTQIQEVVNSGIYNLRIHYPKDEKINDFTEGGTKSSNQTNLRKKDYLVKIICSGDALPVLNNCKKIYFNDSFYQIESDPRPHGVVSYQFYNFYLKAVN